MLRLASLLWRLRRATTMETGLFEIQADYMREFRQSGQMQSKSEEIIYPRFGRPDSVDADPDRTSHGSANGTQAPPSSGPMSLDPAIDLARCFLRLANLPSYPLDRLSRYEAILWRQTGQILFALDALDRRKPQDRGRRFRIGSRQDLPADRRDDYLLLNTPAFAGHTTVREPPRFTRLPMFGRWHTSHRLLLVHGLLLLPLGFSWPAASADRLERLPGGICTHWKAPPCHGARHKQTSV